ncbi:MAG: SPOR domain-containing protein [Pseudomonadota bacterium]
MRLPFIIAVVLLAGSGLSHGLGAKTLAEGSTPVNFPPADYTGRSFVDNDGCVYLRAGVDGNVQWVPRVSRSRQVICGQTPTFGGGTRVAAAPAPARTPAPAPAARPTAAPVVAAAPAPRAAPAAAAPTSVRRTAATVAPRPTPRTVPAAAPVPRVVRRVAPAPVLSSPVVTISPPQPTTPRSERVVVKTVRTCSGAVGSVNGVRCGPQVQSPSSGSRIIAGGRAWNTGAAQAASKKIIIGQPGASGRLVPVSPPVPHGYRSVWGDDRLNPLRGVPSNVTVVASGGAGPTGQYDLAWTKSLPHLLFDRKTGLVVGDKFPQLIYPNTDLSAVNAPAAAKAQTVARAPVTRGAHPVARDHVFISAKSPAPARAAQVAQKPAALVQRAPQASMPLKRHVQAGTYGSLAAAKADAQRLANAGLRTRIGSYTAQGQRRQVIVLGPFNSSGDVNRALAAARGMGFYGAVATK